MKVLLVGGAGYIGSRLNERLQMEGLETKVLDAGILGPIPGMFQGDIRQGEPDLVGIDVVLWLASIHDIGNDDEAAWEKISYEIMVRQPLFWASAALRGKKRMIYFSSTRAGTHNRRLYGKRKRRFEEVIKSSGYDHVTIVRPGTVWGALRNSLYLPNRTHTVLNRMLIQPDWMPEPLEEPFFTVHYRKLEDTIVHLINHPDDPRQGLVVPVTDSLYPITGRQIVQGWRPAGWAAEPVPAGLELGRHPMEFYKEYYHG